MTKIEKKLVTCTYVLLLFLYFYVFIKPWAKK